jgi:hypothetical protein
MTENPHEKKFIPPKREKVSPEDEKREENGAWAEDQKERGYYYDDAHGYEIFTDDEEKDEED